MRTMLECTQTPSLSIVRTPVSAETLEGTSTVTTAYTGIIASVLLPAYNEAEALPDVLRSLCAVLDERYEIIVIDDASTDETAEIALRYPCRLLRHERNRGKGAAVRTGLEAARGAFIVVMDADNTYPAGAVPELVSLGDQYDFVRGARLYSAKQMPLANRIGNKIFDTLLQTLHGLEGKDHLTGLYGLRRDVLTAMNLTSDRFDLEVEIGIKARALRLRTTSITIAYQERLGDKKLRALQDGWHILQRSIALGLRHTVFGRFRFRAD